MGISGKRARYIYLIIYLAFAVAINSINGIFLGGELDDYSLPVASIMTDYNFEISEQDVAAYKEIFPQLAAHIDRHQLTGFFTKAGEEITWYFPVYSIVSIPFVLALQVLGQPTEYAFVFTNVTALFLALLVVDRCLKVNDRKKLILIVLLSIHPVIFYIGWISAEVVIYAFLIIGMVCWYNKWYKRAAISVALAGMLNPTVLSVGIIMIVQYLVRLIKFRNKQIERRKFIKESLPQVIAYGACYTPGLTPFAYNYFHTGHFNLQVANGLTEYSSEPTIFRFLSYLFDLNYGILPYLGVLLVLGIFLLVIAVAKMHEGYIGVMAMFFLNMYMYSIMSHVNCGMSGISRYNVWCSAILIFGICVYFDELTYNIITKNIVRVALPVSVVLTASVLLCYGLFTAKNTSYVRMTPIARYVLDRVPILYNPLHSTFASRVMNIDGGYSYDTPVIYTAEDGFIRKILADEKDFEELQTDYTVLNSDYKEWFAKEIGQLSEKEGYISVPQNCQLIKCKKYELGTPLLFDAECYNASDYVVSGLSFPESWGTWTNGNELALYFQTDSQAEILHGAIHCEPVNETQRARIFVNEILVYDETVSGDVIQFDFKNPGGHEAIACRVELPDAISPREFSQSKDGRKLSLALHEIIFTEQ